MRSLIIALVMIPTTSFAAPSLMDKLRVAQLERFPVD